MASTAPTCAPWTSSAGPGHRPRPPRPRLSASPPGGAPPARARPERAGYVRRRPDSGDRRRLVVEATQVTTARDREVFGELVRKTSDLLAAYSDDQLLVIRDFLTRARKLTAAYADALSSPQAAAAARQSPPAAYRP